MPDLTNPTGAQVSVEQSDREELIEIARRLHRSLEMQAAIMRDPARTGGWRGAENTARAFERQSEKARELHTRLAATQTPAREEWPAGWKLVPVEPTEAMKKAVGWPFMGRMFPDQSEQAMTRMWSAMVAASPTQPATGGTTDAE